MTEFYEQVKERLMRYARINTESDPHSISGSYYILSA